MLEHYFDYNNTVISCFSFIVCVIEVTLGSRQAQEQANQVAQLPLLLPLRNA